MTRAAAANHPKQAIRARPAANEGASPPRFGLELRNFALLSASSVLMFSVIFPPIEFWPFALICLAPWTYAVCTTSRPWMAYWVTWLVGWLFFLANLLWLKPVTGLGFVALAFYLAAYWPLTAFAVRTGLRHGIAPLWTLPVVWTACEYIRAWLMSGFPWLFIGHAFYEQLWLIQISDLTGAYGVTFLALLVNGALATGLCITRRGATFSTLRRQCMVGVAAIAALFAAAAAYGVYRLGQASQFTVGPRVAVVQEDCPLLSTPPFGEPAQKSFARYMALGASAAAARPDLLVFPETAWAAKQNIEFVEGAGASLDEYVRARRYGRLCHIATSAFARGDYARVNEVLAGFEAWLYGDFNRAMVWRPWNWSEVRLYGLPRLPGRGAPVTVVIGSIAVESFPTAVYPKSKLYNSALVYDPDGRQREQRYDKQHLVPFGEVVPFRYGRLHFLYRWLNSLSPFSEGGKKEYSMTPGDSATVFELQTGEQTWRFGTAICYEDVMPYVIRRFVWDGSTRRVDFLLNISNDGWFLYSPELPQHLAIGVFRAVENRVGFARAVNTGISAFIDPNGRIYSVVEKDGRRYGPGTTGFRIDHVQIDRRSSFYGRFGDVFAMTCLVLAAALWAVGAWARWLAAIWRHWTRRRAAGES